MANLSNLTEFADIVLTVLWVCCSVLAQHIFEAAVRSYEAATFGAASLTLACWMFALGAIAAGCFRGLGLALLIVSITLLNASWMLSNGFFEGASGREMLYALPAYAIAFLAGGALYLFASYLLAHARRLSA